MNSRHFFGNPVYCSEADVLWRIFKLTDTGDILDIKSERFQQNNLNLHVASMSPTKVSKNAKIRNRYNQVPHLNQDTNGKVTNSHLDTTNDSQEVSPFPAGDHKAQINRHAQRHNKHMAGKQVLV